MSLCNKPLRWLAAAFLVYAAGIAVFLFGLPRPIPIPADWMGTPADPATFIPAEELAENALFARIRDFLYFVQAPFTWLLLSAGLFAGWFSRGKAWLERRVKPRVLSGVLFIIAVFAFIELAEFPFRAAYYTLSRVSGVSNMGIGFWFTDQLKASLVSTAVMFPVVLLLFLFIRNSEKRWWLWMGIASAPLILFYTFIQPVVLAPLFNDFKPLGETALKEEILALAAKADIPAEQVYEVNMARRTNALNAYVTGIGSNARIVLWDTTLTHMPRDGILFTMAHEMGHYKMKHVHMSTLLLIGGTFLMLYVIFHLANWLLRHFGRVWGIRTLTRTTALPVILLIFMFLNFMSTPLSVAVSRSAEMAADGYAIEVTQTPEAGISGFQKLARTSRSETYPPAFIKWWRYTHPPISERLHRFSEAKETMP